MCSYCKTTDLKNFSQGWDDYCMACARRHHREYGAESVVTDHENCGMGPSYCIECGEDDCFDCDTYCDNCEQTIHKNCIEQHGDDCLEAESFGAENKTKFEATGISDYVWVLKEQNRHGTEVSIHKTKQGITQFLDEYDGNVEELDEGDWGWSGYFGNNSFNHRGLTVNTSSQNHRTRGLNISLAITSSSITRSTLRRRNEFFFPNIS